MNGSSIPILVLAALSLTVGLFFLSIYLKNRKFQVSGSFSLVCFAIVVYDIGCLGLYNSTDFAASAQWQRLQFMGIAAISVTVSYFYNRLVGGFSGRTLPWIAIANLLFCIAIFFIRNRWTLTPAVPAEKTVAIGKFLHARYMEVQPGIICNVQLLFTLVVFTICIIGWIDYQRRTGGKSMTIVIAMVAFYAAGLNDAFIAVGAYSFIYLFEYAFAGVIASMAVTLIRDFLDLYDQVEKMNLDLAELVKERTSEVKVLSGLLPICASCKKIRDDKGYWNQIETYLKDHSDATFSHGICPDCRKRLYPELEQLPPDGDQ